jgi:hypothetical protein
LLAAAGGGRAIETAKLRKKAHTARKKCEVVCKVFVVSEIQTILFFMQ